MKRILLAVLISCLLLTIGTLCYMSFQRYQTKAKIAAQISQLPAFQFLNMDSAVLGAKDLLEQKPLVIIFFNTTCEYCQQEAQLLSREQDSLKAATILWVSEESIADISTFAKYYRLPFRVLKAQAGYSYRQFGVNAIPTILIYDRQRKLVKQLKGASSVAAITRHL